MLFNLLSTCPQYPYSVTLNSMVQLLGFFLVVKIILILAPEPADALKSKTKKKPITSYYETHEF